MDGTRKSILRLAAGGIIWAIGRFSEEVGVAGRLVDRGVPLLFLVTLTTLLGRTVSVAGLVLPDGGLSWGAFLFREEDSGAGRRLGVTLCLPGGLPGFLFIGIEGSFSGCAITIAVSVLTGPSRAAKGTLSLCSPTSRLQTCSSSIWSSLTGPSLANIGVRSVGSDTLLVGPSLSWEIGSDVIGTVSSEARVKFAFTI